MHTFGCVTVDNMPPIEVIINASGGSFVEDETEAQLREAFAECGLEANIRLAKNGAIGEFAEAAAKCDAEIIVAGGGDGNDQLGRGNRFRN